MAKKKTRARGARFADDAALQAIVRYEPEESGLKALAQQARADYGVSVRQAQTTGDLTLQAAREAIPSVANIYDRAGLDQAKTASLVSPELAALSGPGAATLQRGGALEVAQQLGNLRAAKAAALEDLNTRAVAARQGQQYGILNARQKFSADMAKILGQSQSLQRQKGAFTASTINSLLQSSLERQLSARNNARTTRTQAANSKRAQTQQERNSLRSSGIDPDTGKPIPGGKLDPKAPGKKPKLQTPAQHGAVKDQVSSIQSWIRQNRADYGSRHEMANDLVTGVPASTIKVDSKGKPLPAPVRDPGVPKAPSVLAASIALDLEFDGHVSRRNIAELHKRRLSLNQLGFKGAAGTKPRPKPKPVRPVARRRRGTSGAIPGLGNISFGR
jgi:hypothetical protein